MTTERRKAQQALASKNTRERKKSEGLLQRKYWISREVDSVLNDLKVAGGFNDIGHVLGSVFLPDPVEGDVNSNGQERRLTRHQLAHLLLSSKDGEVAVYAENGCDGGGVEVLTNSLIQIASNGEFKELGFEDGVLIIGAIKEHE